MTSDEKPSREQSAKSKAAYSRMRAAVDRAYEETGAAREFGISTPREHYIHDPYKINDPNFWRELSIGMVDNFRKDEPAKLGYFNDALAELADAVKNPPVHKSGYQETVDKFDPLLQVMAFVFGIAAVTEPEQVTDRDIRRVMSSINSVKRSLLQYRKNSAERSESEKKQNTLRKIRRANVRQGAQYAVENDIDPFDLGLVSDPEVIDTVMEMYRIMKMQRNQARGQNALATARLELYRKRVTSLVNRHRTLLKKSKGLVTADAWRKEELEAHKEEDKQLVQDRKADLWNEKHPRSKKHRDKGEAKYSSKSKEPSEKAEAEAETSISASNEEPYFEEERILMEEYGITSDEE